ncbi:YcgL domain-containing protein [Actinobacillus lignieresii]|uniref:YcgL domain-containing protein NCTC4191_00659 n=1 Tax=Actinobacillus lignieresii TaxID=720 RepID=A0A380TVK6_ACTLI|nr:YcgL domain-containing protein [Actinobacillus lignieresii]SUT91838.1 YcgL domain [Actinobacillus lignieresii]SUT96847.1 YcgL domain [Actinobacillus lignieresii]VEB26003.1 YcgL domain [Actinobacillus lignieresii]
MSTNLCAIYKSPKREGMFLYVAKRDQFDNVPEALRQMFGKPQFVMLFNLNGEKQLKRSKNEEVLQAIQTQGFFLQMPPPPENLLKTFLEQHKGGN